MVESDPGLLKRSYKNNFRTFNRERAIEVRECERGQEGRFFHCPRATDGQRGSRRP